MKHQDIETLPKVSQVKLDLIAAKMLIDAPERWCRDETERACPDGRTERCSFGALVAVNYEREDNRLILEAYHALLKEVPFTYTMASSVERFNDTHTHAEVMALWDRAIARA